MTTMSEAINLVAHEFADSENLAAAFANEIAQQLGAAIAARGSATLAVSGGNTPKRFFQALSQQELAWGKVKITLVDERCVPADNARSNESLVRANLLQNKAAAAAFVALFENGAARPE